jgi:diketogulonate reductase-like aldo/keto reductase
MAAPAPPPIGALRVPIASSDARATIPLLGLGTWNAARDKVAEAVRFALVEEGIRHVDCAAVYGARGARGCAARRSTASCDAAVR